MPRSEFSLITWFESIIRWKSMVRTQLAKTRCEKRERWRREIKIYVRSCCSCLMFVPMPCKASMSSECDVVLSSMLIGSNPLPNGAWGGLIRCFVASRPHPSRVGGAHPRSHDNDHRSIPTFPGVPFQPHQHWDRSISTRRQNPFAIRYLLAIHLSWPRVGIGFGGGTLRSKPPLDPLNRSKKQPKYCVCSHLSYGVFWVMPVYGPEYHNINRICCSS